MDDTLPGLASVIAEMRHVEGEIDEVRDQLEKSE